MSPHECTQKENIEHIIKTLYFGNGKPALTVQIEGMNNKLDSVVKDIDGIKAIAKWALLGLLSLIGLTAWQMFQRHTADMYKQEVSNYAP